MSFLFGGSKEQTKSYNKAYDTINNATSGALPFITQGGNALSAMLGLGGSAEQQAGFDRWKDSAGYQFMMDSGSKAITGNQASRGLLNSGSTLKALNKFGQGVGAQYQKDYMSQLLGLSNLGLGAGGLLANAGQYSEGSKSSSNGGLFGTSGGGPAAMIGAILSDRRTKENIEYVKELVPGVNVYTYNYKGKNDLQIGVMADEVKEVFPEALGPTTDEGYMTVDYTKLNELVKEVS